MVKCIDTNQALRTFRNETFVGIAFLATLLKDGANLTKMTTVISSQRENIPRKLPALPVIEHPSSRLGNKSELQVRGSSRDDDKLGEDRHGNRSQTISSGALPPVKGKRERGKKNHSRILTWPFGES